MTNAEKLIKQINDEFANGSIETLSKLIVDSSCAKCKWHMYERLKIGNNTTSCLTLYKQYNGMIDTNTFVDEYTCNKGVEQYLKQEVKE